MIIGLIDLDLQQSQLTSILIPNIEIMKLATYYKVEENKFCRLISLDEQNLDPYEKIYIFSESVRPPQVPEAFKRATNVIYGGSAFTNNKYIPFENSIIDFTIPRTAIYKEFLKEKYDGGDGIKTKVIRQLLDSTYYRNYAGKERLPLPAIIPHKRVILYDRDFFYHDWHKTIEDISNKSPSSIMRIHPIICNTLTQFFEVRAYTKISRTSDIILDLDLPASDFNYMMRRYKNKFLAEIQKTSNIYLSLGGTFHSRQLYMQDFVYKINLLYLFWTNNIPIKIKYIYPEIGHIDPLYNLSQTICSWTQGKTMYSHSINERIPKDKNKKEIRPARKERDELIQVIPEAKDLFSYSFNELSLRGWWKYDH